MAHKEELTDVNMARLLSENNRLCWEVIYDRYGAALYGFINTIIQRDDVTEEVFTETFLQLKKNIGQFNPVRESLFSRMLNIARNLATDKIHSKDFLNARINQDIELIVIGGKSKNISSYDPELTDIKEIVGSLDNEYSQLIDLMYFQGFTNGQTAEKLNIPIGTVKTRLRAGILKLRQNFGII